VTVDLRAPIETVKGIGPRRAEALAGAGIRTAQDLLLTLPFRYEDRSHFASISALAPGVRAAVKGRILSAVLRRTRTRGFTLFNVRIEDESGVLPCLWYNQPYLRNVLKEGRNVVLFGEATVPERGKPELRFLNPQYEILGDDPERIHTGRIVPIYRKVGDLSSRRLRGLLHGLLHELPPDPGDPLPAGLCGRLGLPCRTAAFREAHFPAPGTSPALLEAGLTPAHRRLAFEELFLLQASLERARDRRRALSGVSIQVTPQFRLACSRILPFRLTPAQKRVLEEILRDLSGPAPMSRLLHGEVGSGKTVVALLAAVAAMESGCQVALMVPTEILAEQHYQTLGRLLTGTGHRPALLTSGQASTQRRGTLKALAGGSVGLVVGTHALIQEEVEFRRLGLVIVDEQHRFGVRQRTLLQEKGRHPHLLLMTATPIPRSLALVLYGDMEVSVLDEVPRGRGVVRTVLRTSADRAKIHAFIRREAGEGRRTAIVYPLVRESEGSDLRSAVNEARSLARGPLSGVAVGLLHGKMSSEERNRAMAGFAAGRTRVLVTTTVVEVGIDVPEATVMVVESAERFGLSQLHQLRGRVGRGASASWCILIRGERISPEAEARLQVVTDTSDGFEIARRDLELRGPGELRGLRQSGDPGLRVADLVRDEDLLEIAREEAARVAAGPGGQQPRSHPRNSPETGRVCAARFPTKKPVP